MPGEVIALASIDAFVIHRVRAISESYNRNCLARMIRLVDQLSAYSASTDDKNDDAS